MLLLYSFLAFLFQTVSSRDFDDLSFLNDYFIKKEGDIVTFNKTKFNGMKSSALKGSDVKWPKAEVPVFFSAAYTYSEKREIIDAMLEIHNKTCVRFRLANDEDNDYILFVKPRQSDCASMVGRQGGVQPLFLASGCFTRKVILHELMHSLSFIHEHNRADRDDYVSVRWNNIKEGETHNFDKRKRNSLSLMDTKYAYDSIMHYEGTEFSENGGHTLIPKRKEVRTMGGGEILSPIDVLRINKYYNCPVYGDEIQLEEPVTTKTTTTTEELEIEVPTEPETTWRSRFTTTKSPYRPQRTTTENTPSYRLSSTLFPPLKWQKRECQNPFDAPKEDGDCRWLIMRVVPDPHSLFHYLHCLPSLRNSDIRCGVWKRKSCARGLIFDRELRSCRSLHSIINESEESEEYY